MARFSLHVVGKDRLGLIATVTAALERSGCNLKDSRMTILHGQSSMMLAFDAPDITNGALIEEKLAPVADELNLFFVVRPLPTGPVEPRTGVPTMITFKGVDRPGIVARLTAEISRQGVNIVDLTGEHRDESGTTICTLELLVDRPDTVAPESLEAGLRAVANSLDAELTMRPLL